MSVWVVIGGQFGSEGKGKISAAITLREEIDICIRCGGPNSGHSVVDGTGTTYALQQLPTGYLREKTRLLIPSGGLIDLEILKAELDLLKLDNSRVGIDRSAMVVTEQDRTRERELNLADRLSSTLSGVGAALARRILRQADVTLAADAAKDCTWLRPLLTDVSHESNQAISAGKKVLIEGTQGSGLSLYHSPYFPKTTSRDTNAAGFLSEVGVSPRVITEIVMVIRTFPIRVFGKQAGPLNDLSWDELQTESGYPTQLHEYTTVTKKLRRIGRFDWPQVTRAVEINRPTRLAINFLDYIAYDNVKAKTVSDMTERTKHFIRRLEAELSTPVYYYGVGPRIEDTIVPDLKTDSLRRVV